MQDITTLSRRLWLAAIVFAAGSAIHVADHLRRGQGSTNDTLLALGNVALVLQVLVVTLVLVGHPSAPCVAAVLGPALAIGFTAAHWLPHWGEASDPVWQVESWRWVTVIASLAEILGAIALGVSGSLVLRRQWRGVPFGTEEAS